MAALGQLGVGKLHKYDDLGRAVVHFGGEGTRIIAPKTPISRVRLSECTPVRFKTAAGTVAVGEVVDFLIQREDGGFVYRVVSDSQIHDVWEGLIMPVGETTDPMQLLKAYRWDTPRSYIARWSMADIYGRWCATSGGLPAMLGARVIPLGHQVYAARRVLFDRTPRFILADEVGLGKTIEAGMIIQALQAERRNFSVLVVAPGSMSRQWLTETYLRFGARAYHHIDCARLVHESRASLSALAADQRLIVATTALEAHPELAKMIAARRWDMVVVDEAHQISPGHALYPHLQLLARQSDGLLLLSATPSKRDMAGLVGLLALVAPDAFADETPASLQAKYDRQSAVWDRLNFTRKLIDSTAAEGRELDSDEVEFVAVEWVGLIEGDELFDALLERMRSGEAQAAIELVAYVQEFHRLDHRIIRTRRATLASETTSWPARIFIELPWAASQAEAIFLNHLQELPEGVGPQAAAVRALYQRFCSTSPNAAVRFLEHRREAIDDGPNGKASDPIGRIAGDSGPNDEPIILAELIQSLASLEGEDSWLRTATDLAEAWLQEGGFSRADLLASWLDDHLKDPDNQVLVFVQDAEAANDLADRLETRYGVQAVARFHCNIDEEHLASTAFRFQHNKSCRVLVSDELGGEGRNFQNASAVVHFDVPTSCARLEQRIGRLDRVGRESDREVLSVLLEPATAADRTLLEIHRDVFQVFNRSIGGLEFILPKLQLRVQAAYGESPSALRAIISDLRAEVDASLSATDEAFDISLDATKPQLDRSIALAAEMEDESDTAESAATLRSWASRLGIQTKKCDDGSSEFRWTNGSLNIASDRLKIGTGADGERRLVCGTFARKTALERDDLQFFAPGHSLIDTMIFEAEHGRHSRVTAFMLDGFPKHKGTFLLQVLARSVLDERVWVGHDIGPGLAARARSLLWPEVTAEIMLLRDSRGAHQDIVTHGGLRGLLDHPRGDLNLRAIEPSMISELPFLAELWGSIDKSVPIALASIATRRAASAHERAEALETSLRGEIGFLRWQAHTATDGAATHEFRAAVNARQALIQSVRSPRTDLLGLALVAMV
ncbi:SNF2-related protein [Methylosinus sporium]|uniref:SNF2-related protein n=1 Tax=Methylosinus sporium TaxID=428 RepID=UPI00383A1541